MNTFKVSCQEERGKSFNYIIGGQDYRFMGGKPTKINDSIWEYIKGKKNSKGKPLFVKEVGEEAPILSQIEEIEEAKAPGEKIEISSSESVFSVLDLKPPIKKVASQNKSFKSLTKKVQGKLV